MKRYQEENVEIQGTYKIAGTIGIPEGKGPFPAVLLISGSGDGNRDGNFLKGKLLPNIYKGLADIISNMGFVTLRVDKRGVGESGGDLMEAGMFDLVEDIENCVAYLAEHPKVDRIILLGHSEGCTLITAVNARRPVDGLIFISGGAESTSDALLRQRAIAKEELMNTKGLKGALLRLLRVDAKIDRQAENLNKKIMGTNKSIIRYQFQKINAKWFREHYEYNVFDDLEKVLCPSLAVNGDKDIQVTPEKAKDIGLYVKGPAEGVIIENMDHILKEALQPASVLNVSKEYKANEKKPTHPKLQEKLEEWLTKHYKTPADQ